MLFSSLCGMKQEKSNERPVFELKGSVLTVMVLFINEVDPDLLYPKLVKKIEQGRAFFKNAPVLIDLSGLDEARQSAFDLSLLATTLRELSLIPVAVRGAAGCFADQITATGMGQLPAVRGEKTVDVRGDAVCRERELPTEKTVEPAAGTPSDKGDGQSSSGAQPDENAGSAAPTRVITQPVRSGQQVLAPHGDLVVLSSVNAGAEVLAAGNIHVYGALRGRAMAGIHGDTSARVFSLQCNPELVAVAGEYVVNELLEKDVINTSVAISLSDGSLKFTPLGSSAPERH